MNVHGSSWIALSLLLLSTLSSLLTPHPAPPPAAANPPLQLEQETWTLACSNLAHLLGCANKHYSSALQVARLLYNQLLAN